MKRRALIFAAAVLALAPCEAQIRVGGGAIILNGRVIQPAGNPEGAEEKVEDANPAAAQVLEFADGSRLHGTLEALDSVKKEIVWRGVDASAPITFSLPQISNLIFAAKAKPEIKVRATVKLIGGDWLAADVLGLRDGKLQLKLGDGTALAVNRAHLEWVSFSKTAATECYDGPRSLSGWASGGGWTFREGALRASQPSIIGRFFEALPDQVEYRFEFDQGSSFRAYAILLHGAEAIGRGFGPGMVRLMVNDMNLQLWAQTGDNVKQEQVDLAKILPVQPKAVDADGAAPAHKKPMRWRIFEDRPAGRIIVFIDGRKVGDWAVGKGKPGENRGAFSFQPMAWSSNSEQSLSKIRVGPWDGFVPVDDALEGVRPKADQVVLTDGETQEGRIESITADKVKLGGVLVAREKIALLRFARTEHPPEEDPAMARLRLAQRGEFDAAAIGFKDGKMRLRTNFGGELILNTAALREVEFAHLLPVAGKPVDLLVFKNGDQLRGLLESAGNGQKLGWRATAANPPVEIDPARAAGVLMAAREQAQPIRRGVLARGRNGDFLAGDFVSLDPQHLILDNGAAGRVTLPRGEVQALYFASGDRLPVLDGAAERELWEIGLEFNTANAALRKKRAAEGKPIPSPWSYFDGAFSIKHQAANRSNNSNNGNINLGRIIEELPPKVDFSFDVISKSNQVFCSLYLFSEPDNSGYMMQLHPTGIFIYDTGGQQRGRAMIQQQQMQFGEKVNAKAPQHRIRVLADRPAGRVTILVDGVFVGNFGPKASAPPRNLGRGLGLMPQQNMAVTFANLWIAPWNGQVPGQAPTGTVPQDSVLLANGDEAQGKIGSATPEALQLESEVGMLDLPVKRLTMVEFGGPASEASSGARLRLHDRSVLTVSAYRIENGSVVCQSALAGELKFPISAVQELVFASAVLPPAAKPPEKPATPVPAKAEIRARRRPLVDRSINWRESPSFPAL